MSKTSRFARPACVAALIAAIGPGLLRAQAPPEPPTLANWWADLEKDDPQASRALLKLAASPKETTAFLKDKLPPLTVDAGRVQFLLTVLGDDKEEVWKPAFEELEYFDPRLAIGLEDLMPMAPEAPTRQRMVEVLSGREAGSLGRRSVNLRSFGEDAGKKNFNFFAEAFGSWWAEPDLAKLNSFAWGNSKKKWTRAVRAIMLLESFNTPEATGIIKAMATGHPDAQPTRVAKEALERLGVKAG